MASPAGERQRGGVDCGSRRPPLGAVAAVALGGCVPAADAAAAGADDGQEDGDRNGVLVLRWLVSVTRDTRDTRGSSVLRVSRVSRVSDPDHLRTGRRRDRPADGLVVVV